MQTSQVGGHFAANSIPLATYSLLSAHQEAVTLDNSILVINLGTFETDLPLTFTHCHLDFNLCLSSYPSFSVLVVQGALCRTPACELQWEVVTWKSQESSLPEEHFSQRSSHRNRRTGFQAFQSYAIGANTSMSISSRNIFICDKVWTVQSYTWISSDESVHPGTNHIPE